MKTYNSKHIKEILKHSFLSLRILISNDYTRLKILIPAVDNEVRAK